MKSACRTDTVTASCMVWAVPIATTTAPLRGIWARKQAPTHTSCAHANQDATLSLWCAPWLRDLEHLRRGISFGVQLLAKHGAVFVKATHLLRKEPHQSLAIAKITPLTSWNSKKGSSQSILPSTRILIHPSLDLAVGSVCGANVKLTERSCATLVHKFLLQLLVSQRTESELG
jgi:hypothetical protein